MNVCDSNHGENRERDMDVATKSPTSMHKKVVILLMGMPASGKSTLAQRLKQEFDVAEKCNSSGMRAMHFTRLVHIEYDAIEDEVVMQDETKAGSAEQLREAWNQARQIAMDRLQKEMKEAPSDGEIGVTSIILLDDNFHLRGMRKQIHRLALKYQPIHFGILYKYCSLEVCLRRNQQRERGVPDHVIEKMYCTLEPPKTMWERDGVMEITDDTPFVDVIDFVCNCPEIVDLPEEMDKEQQEADRAKTLANQTHFFDKLLRSWVGQVAKTNKIYAKAANDARKELLQRLKAGTLSEIDDGYQLKVAFLDLVLLPSNVEDDNLRKRLNDALII
jgi:tRNA uridine 5-carbamoylmethylation protein Kti12